MRGLMLSLGLALPVGVGGEQEKNIVVQASALCLGLVSKGGTLRFGIKAEVDGWVDFHWREGRTNSGPDQTLNFYL